MKLPVPSFIRTHKKKSIAGAIIVLLAVIGFARAGQPAEPEYVTAVAARADLRQTVEAVGTVVSEKELELRFANAGIVAAVHVKEGQRVAAGEHLAQLRAGSLGATVAAQQASLQSALAELRAMEEGTRPEDIAVTEADLQSKRAALQVAQSTLASAEKNLTTAEEQLKILQQEADVSLSGQVSTSMSSLAEHLVGTDNALTVLDDVLSSIDVQDAIVRDHPGADNDIRSQKRDAQTLITSARATSVLAHDYQTALSALDSGRRAISAAGTTMDALFTLISSLPETNNFTSVDREGYKTTISTQRSRIQDAGSSVSTLQSTLRNASAGYDTKIAAQKASITSNEGARDKSKIDILTYQAAVQTAEAQLALKRAGSRQTDIDAARARVRSAQANLARAQADYTDTLLVAPSAGIVSHINIKVGESLPTGPAMMLIGDSPFRIEMFVSEIDVPKLALSQSGSVELDAYRGTHMKLQLSEVDNSPTLKDGVSKYGVKLDFVHPHNELKIGMTGDAEIVTGMRNRVIAIPRRAVLDGKNEGEYYVRILKADKSVEERQATIGMEGESGDVEVSDGVKEGETVIVLVKK